MSTTAMWPAIGKRKRRQVNDESAAPAACAAALILPLLLSGCSYFIPTKRHLPVPKAPAIVQTVTPEELVKQLNDRWEALNSLTATVEIYATELRPPREWQRIFLPAAGTS